MKEELKRFFIALFAFAALPLFCVTVVWLLTIGSFDWLATVHHGNFLGLTGICLFFGFFMGAGMASE